MWKGHSVHQAMWVCPLKPETLPSIQLGCFALDTVYQPMEHRKTSQPPVWHIWVRKVSKASRPLFGIDYAHCPLLSTIDLQLY